MKEVAIGTPVRLVSTEVNVVKAVARERRNANIAAGVYNAKVVKGDELQKDIEGLGAEYGFCKLFNVMIDLTSHIRSSKNGGDDGDAVLHNGLVVDVKSTVYHTGRLLCVPWKITNNVVNLFCLMTGSFPFYTFKGFYLKDEMFQDKNRIEINGYKSFGVSQVNLLTLEQAVVKLTDNGFEISK